MRRVTGIIVAFLLLSILVNAILWAKLRFPKPIITVNDQAMTKNDMDNYLEAQYGPGYKAMMVQRILVDQEAKKDNLAPTQAEVDEEFNTQKEIDWQYANQLNLRPWLVEEAKNAKRQEIEQQRLLAKDIPVTDEEVKMEYIQHSALYDTPSKAHCAVAAVLNETHIAEIQSLMSRTPPVSPQVIMQAFPREVVFLGDNNVYTFLQAYGVTEMNKEIFSMELKSVKTILPGELAQQGARRLVVRLDEIVTGKKADLNDPKILARIKLNVAMRRSRPLQELLTQLWNVCKFTSVDPNDRSQVERQFFPDKARQGVK